MYDKGSDGETMDFVKGERVINKVRKCAPNDGSWITHLMMEKLRKKRGNPRLCYLDLTLEERREFDLKAKRKRDRFGVLYGNSIEVQQEMMDKLIKEGVKYARRRKTPGRRAGGRRSGSSGVSDNAIKRA